MICSLLSARNVTGVITIHIIATTVAVVATATATTTSASSLDINLQIYFCTIAQASLYFECAVFGN